MLSKKLYTKLGSQLGLLSIDTAKSVPYELRIENCETFEFSLNAGLEYEVFEDWSVLVTYVQGMTNNVRGRDLRNSVVYVGISYSII